MTHPDEIATFRAVWDAEAESTIRLLEALPVDQYDFRPDPKGRSIGELAWHLSEIDACLTFGIAEGRFRLEDEPPDLKRPRDIKLLAPGYRRVHEQAAARLRDLQNDQLDRVATFFDGRQLTTREVLRDQLLHHLIHHRAQLVLLCRMAGGAPPGLYGPNREEMQALRDRTAAGKVQVAPPLSEATRVRMEALFAESERVEASTLLVERCGNNLPFCEHQDAVQMERTRFAALKLSGGRLSALREAVDLACIDSRDLLMAAGFGEDLQAHLRWLPPHAT